MALSLTSWIFVPTKEMLSMFESTTQQELRAQMEQHLLMVEEVLGGMDQFVQGLERRIARIEELTRIPADVQDTLITILSEKTLPVPELGMEFQAVPGFSVIATANNRDKGVNELSSALKRRFNTVVLPVPASQDEEVQIVTKRVGEQSRALQLPAQHGL